MGELAGILFHVRALDRDLEGATILKLDLDATVEGDRLVELADLVVLREVGIEVVLAREPTGRSDAAAACSLTTGRLPGRPRSTGVTLVFGSPPKKLGASENILVFVFSSTCTSKPSTGSNSSRASS
jgi:hypothetical protein